MKYIYEISQAKKYNYSGIVIPTLIVVDEENITTKKEVKQERIIIPSTIFENIFKLGKELNINYGTEKYLSLSKKWIIDNYFPFPENELYKYGNKVHEIFADKVNDVYVIYSTGQILKRLLKNKTISRDYIDRLKIYYEIIDMEGLVKEYGNSIDPEYYNEMTFDKYIGLVKNISIDETNKNVFVYISLHILINYIFNLSKGADYIVSALRPIELYINKKPKYFLYKSTNCIMGIVYYELLNSLVSDNNNLNIEECVYCHQYFTKNSGNQFHCERCISLNIPKKNRDKSFHSSSKGKIYHKEYYKEYYLNKVKPKREMEQRKKANCNN